MRAPPPTAVICTPGLGWRGVQAGLQGLAAGVAVVWVGQQMELDFVWAMAGPIVLLVTALAWAFSSAASSQLRWTGAQWALVPGMGEEVPVPAPAVAMDLGGWLLLRLADPDVPARWLAVSRHAAGAGWLPFRAAVYSGASPSTSLSPSERAPF